MAKKGRKFETRTLLIIVFVLLVIVAAYIVITNLPPEENFLTPEEILNNKDLYLDGDIITVQGYYIIVGGKEYVVSTLDVSTDGRSTLNLDTTAINETLIYQTTYQFTGSLKLDPEDPIGTRVIFVAGSFKEV